MRKIELNGKVDRYSPVHIGGSVNLLSAALYTDVTMAFKDLDLTIVNPYSGYFAGYLINKGKLSVEVTYKIDQRQLDAQQHFVVDQLELGDRVDTPRRGASAAETRRGAAQGPQRRHRPRTADEWLAR